MSTQNRFSPLRRIGQDTQTRQEFQLRRQSTENPDDWSETVDLTDAESVTITLTHREIDFTLLSDEPCDIVDPEEGVVAYTFPRETLRAFWGDYLLQFEVDYTDGTSETIPPDIGEWFITIARNAGAQFPITLNQPIHGTEAYFEDLEADILTVHDALRGMHTDATESTRITRLDGQGITVGPTGSLDVVWPGVDTYPEGGPHSHLNDTLGSDQLYPRDLRVAGSPHYDVTHPDFNGGAAGDGQTDDTAAIQAAIDAASAAGDGSVVYFPAGEYRITDTLTGAGDITYRGVNRYLSRLRPDFDRDQAARIDFLMYTTNESNIAFENLGIDGREATDAYNDPNFGPLPDGENQEVIPGRWAIIRFNDCSNIEMRSIAAWVMKHIIDCRDCADIQLSDWHYRDCFDGASLIRSEGIQVSDFLARNCSVVIDFANCDHATVTNLNGTCNAYTVDEAIDIGGSNNITIDDVELEGYGTAIQVKGEGGNSWSDITLKNVRARELQDYGFVLTYGGATDANGDPARTGDLNIEGCTLNGDMSTTDGAFDYPSVVGIDADGPVSETSISNTKIDVTGRGLNSTGGNFNISGGRTEVRSRTATALFAYSAGNFNPDITIDGGMFASASDPVGNYVIDVASSPEIEIANAEVRGDGRGGILLRNCQAPLVRDCTLHSLRQDCVRIEYDNETSMTIGANDIPAVVKGCEFRDWGLGGSLRAGVRFQLDGPTGGQYDLLTAKNNQMMIRPNNAVDQRGIHIDGSIDTIGNSDLGENIMSNVSGGVTTGAVTLATSVKQDNIVKLA